MSAQRPSHVLGATPFFQFYFGEEDKEKEVANTPHITNRIEQFYLRTKALRQFVQNVSDERMKLMVSASIVSFGIGVKGFSSGDLIEGSAGICGAKGLWDLCHGEGSEGLQKLLKDIGAGVGMIEELDATSCLLCQEVEKNLERAGDVILLQSRFEAAANLKEIEALKGMETLSVDTQTAYAKAAELFQSMPVQIAEFRNYYDQCSNWFEQIHEIVQGKDLTLTLQEQLEKLDELAYAASEKCRLGKEYLNNARAELESALGELSRANELRIEAIKLVKDTLGLSLYALEEASSIKECEQRSLEAQKKIREILEYSDSIRKLIDELKQDIAKAKEEAVMGFAFSEVAAGLGVAAGMAFPLGLVTGFAVGLTTMSVLHHSATISSAVSKIYHWAWGTPILEVKPMKFNELIRIQFDKGGYFAKQPSVTVGTFRVNLGNGLELEYPFNLNDRNRIAKEDLLSFVQILENCLANDTLQPKRCLDILCKMENVLIERGGWHPNVEGLINKKSPAYAVVDFLKQYCA